MLGCLRGLGENDLYAYPSEADAEQLLKKFNRYIKCSPTEVSWSDSHSRISQILSIPPVSCTLIIIAIIVIPILRLLLGHADVGIYF